MTINEILALGGIDKIIEVLTPTNEDKELDKWKDEYSGKHKILERKDKTVGEGADKKTVVQWREIITFQKKIVRAGVFFVFGKPMLINPILPPEKDELLEDAHAALMELWKANKLDYKNKQIARITMTTTQVAELWYVAEKTDEEKASSIEGESGYTVRMQLLHSGNGNEIFKHVDPISGDMDAFIRRYKIKIGDNEITKVQIYTASDIIT